MIEFLVRLMADGAIVMVALTGAWALLFRLNTGYRIQAYSRVLMAGLTSYYFAKLLGLLYQPETVRPFVKLGVEPGAAYLNNPGFPSDHVLLCAALALAVVAESRSRTAKWLVVGGTVVVALGRVLALVHTPVDVIGAMLIALAGGLWYLQKPQDAHVKGTKKLTRTHSKKRV